MNKLAAIKTVHTSIWLFMNVVITYLIYAVISNKNDKWVWICIGIGIVVLEGMVLLFFREFVHSQKWPVNIQTQQKITLVFIYLSGWQSIIS